MTIVKSLFEKQTRVTDHIRALLIDRMVHTCTRLNAATRSLFLAVKLLDIVLENENLTQDNLLVTGMACLSLGCKMENGISIILFGVNICT